MMRLVSWLATTVGRKYARLKNKYSLILLVFIYEALLIPFEITALSTVLDFWSDDIPPWAIPLACIVSLI